MAEKVLHGIAESLAEGIERDKQEAFSLGILALKKNLPDWNAICSGDDLEEVNLIEIGHGAISAEHGSLMDALLLLSFNVFGFGRLLSEGLGAAIYFELVLKGIISLGRVEKTSSLHPFKDCLISKVEFHSSTNIFILDQAIQELAKKVDLEKDKTLRSVEWMISFGSLKHLHDTSIQSAVNNDLFSLRHGFHLQPYELTQKGQASQARLIEVVRSFGLNHGTPENFFDFAVVLLFYVMNLHHRNFSLGKCVKEDLVFHTAEEITESRKNFGARFKASK